MLRNLAGTADYSLCYGGNNAKMNGAAITGNSKHWPAVAESEYHRRSRSQARRCATWATTAICPLAQSAYSDNQAVALCRTTGLSTVGMRNANKGNTFSMVKTYIPTQDAEQWLPRTQPFARERRHED